LKAIPEIKALSKISRLAGAILAETQGVYYLVGETKEPCDFEKFGFKTLPESDPEKKPKYQKLEVTGPVVSDNSVYLEMATEGEKLAELLFKRFAIHRNYSVSDRLWMVVTSNKDESGRVDARWLEEMPDEVWDIVRDSILKCL